MKTPIKKLSVGVSRELKQAIEESIKDFKATLFIEKIEIKVIDKDYKVYDIVLNLEEKE